MKYAPAFALCLLLCCASALTAQPRATRHSLRFDSLPRRWDEGLPLGNGMLGALVWQKYGTLRLSLDRADWWDLRKPAELNRFDFDWVVRQVRLQAYDTVQYLGDRPYETYPFPTKLPAAALEFDLPPGTGCLSSALPLATPVATVALGHGGHFETFVHATLPLGCFRLSAPADLPAPRLAPPPYAAGTDDRTANSVEGSSLGKLGYGQGKVRAKDGLLVYEQTGSRGLRCTVAVAWRRTAGGLEGAWTVITGTGGASRQQAVQLVRRQAGRYRQNLETHRRWWNHYWRQSEVALPDSLLERQYYLELYKLGCTARDGAPPVTLQAVWTADNGQLPPWKGDFHHDLNTELSYWPAYTANHLPEAASFTSWLWNVRDENRRWTRRYFQAPGLNVPGVTTLTGTEMGGWIQYSLSPTTVAWLSQHFYWQWAYGGDKTFLRTRAYPYVREAAIYLDHMTRRPEGTRRLPLSSSPEYHDNSIRAWFTGWTNYDLALVRHHFTIAAAMAAAAGQPADARHWTTILGHLPGFDADSTGLTIAPGEQLAESHRHHAHLMAIHPLGLLHPESETDKALMDRSLRHLERLGTAWWTGYSFGWAACLYARALAGDSAVAHLRRFATNFCSPNSFHLNGDQKGGQYSRFTYRPFTLEGNFAFAQGIHELLLQSHKGYVEVFPALPASWKYVGFRDLRTEGGFLVSTAVDNGGVDRIAVRATQDGRLRLRLPFKTWWMEGGKKGRLEKDILEVVMKKGETVVVRNGYE